MSQILNDVQKYVEENIGDFHTKRIESLKKLKLEGVLKRKNPYLFRAKNILNASELVKGIIDAHLSSNEETIFGNWLEQLAIFINKKVYNGYKSGIAGIDLEFDKEGIRYIVSIKSGPNWGNSSQIKKLVLDFKKAQQTLRTSSGNSVLHIRAVNGCCYGIERQPDKGDYFKYCGQDFWTFISGDENLYKTIIEPLGAKARERNQEFLEAYNALINNFTIEFAKDFCKADGSIDWQKLLEFNSKSKNKK